MQLPQEFKEKIVKLLGETEFAQYERTLEEERAYGLRPNELKIDKETLRPILAPIITMKEDVAWSHNGMYFDPSSGRMPGRLPYYLAGLYYIQEPSAMYPAEVLEAKPGDKVLDLCAARVQKLLLAFKDKASLYPMTSAPPEPTPYYIT